MLRDGLMLHMADQKVASVPGALSEEDMVQEDENVFCIGHASSKV